MNNLHNQLETEDHDFRGFQDLLLNPVLTAGCSTDFALQSSHQNYISDCDVGYFLQIGYVIIDIYPSLTMKYKSWLYE